MMAEHLCSSSNSSSKFLGTEVTVAEQWQAIYQNMQAYYLRKAHVDEKTRVGSLRDLTWTSNRLCIPSESALEDGQVINEIVSWYRDQNPIQGTVWWYLNPKVPSELEVLLQARGARVEPHPHFMWRSFCETQAPTLPNPSITIRIATEEDYSIPDGESDLMYQALSKVTPRQVFHLVAFRGITRLGRCVVNITTGELGIAMLFDMMVSSQERKQGIGAALLHAASELAYKKMGCNHIALNATKIGERLYRRFGFQSIGYGRTWSFETQLLAKLSSTPEQIRFLEAVGFGDIQTLARLRKSLTHDQLQNSTWINLTPFELAAKCEQSSSASWLLEQDIIPDIISVWDLGWKEVAVTLVSEHPESVKRKYGGTTTPLHIAIERNDVELVKLLLTAPNDFDTRDDLSRTPLGLARHYERKEVLIMLEAYVDTKAPDTVQTILEGAFGTGTPRGDSISTKTET